MQDYREMWSDLGLDLQSHDALLSVLGGAYGDIFLSQKNRPEGMEYFGFRHERGTRASHQGTYGCQGAGQDCGRLVLCVRA